MKVLFGLLLIFFSVALSANDNLDGKELYQKYCSECHQPDGNSNDSNVPNIAGFSAILLYDILDQFKKDDRKGESIKDQNGLETNMNQIAKNLKGEEIEKIALYLRDQKFTFNSQQYDATLASTGKDIHMDLCENCHVDQGTNPIEDAPLLRGQWKPYLIRQFDVLTKRERYMPRRMKKRFRKLSDEDKKALIEFYISPQ